MEFEHTVWYTEVVGCHQDDQLKLLGIHFVKTLDDSHMLWQSLLQIVSTLVADFHQQGCRLAIDESKDTLIHVVVAGDGPVEALSKRIECPETCIVALGGDHFSGSDDACDLTSQIIRPSDMS